MVLGLGIVAAFFGIAISLLVTRIIARPLRAMQAAAEEACMGDADQKITYESKMRRLPGAGTTSGVDYNHTIATACRR